MKGGESKRGEASLIKLLPLGKGREIGCLNHFKGRNE